MFSPKQSRKRSSNTPHGSEHTSGLVDQESDSKHGFLQRRLSSFKLRLGSSSGSEEALESKPSRKSSRNRRKSIANLVEEQVFALPNRDQCIAILTGLTAIKPNIFETAHLSEKLTPTNEISGAYISTAIESNNMASLYSGLQYGMMTDTKIANMPYNIKVCVKAFELIHSCADIDAILKIIKKNDAKIRSGKIKGTQEKMDLNLIIARQFYDFSGVMFLLSFYTSRHLPLKHIVDASRYYYVDSREIYPEAMIDTKLHNMLTLPGKCDLDSTDGFLKTIVDSYIRSENAYDNFKSKIAEGRNAIESLGINVS